MLLQAENEYATRTNAGTPMGQFIRRFWMPALLSEELPEPDCAPLRLKLLGENLVAFRDSNGTVGMLAENCPHRGASLFFGRNEEAGLRCVYHGWKFDIDGNCLDMPNEPAESDFRTRVKAVAYPTLERGGVVWARDARLHRYPNSKPIWWPKPEPEPCSRKRTTSRCSKP
jgi:phthalate 4,5-dioxygenase